MLPQERQFPAAASEELEEVSPEDTGQAELLEPQELLDLPPVLDRPLRLIPSLEPADHGA